MTPPWGSSIPGGPARCPLTQHPPPQIPPLGFPMVHPPPSWGSSISPPWGPSHPTPSPPQDLEPTRGHVSALPLLPPPAPSWPPPARLPGSPRLRALSPPEGMEGDITTVDGHREDDIAVCDGPATAVLLLLRPPSPFLAPAGPPRSPPPSMEEHLAVMHQKLQHELPNFFLKIPDYGLYSHDVEFINHLLHLHTRGRPMYQVAVALCRAVAWGYFASLRLEVLALTRHPEDWSIRARWRLTGLPLHLCLLRFYRRDKRHLLRSYDAFSTFFLNSQGLIRCHRVDKVRPGGHRGTPQWGGGGHLVALGTVTAPPACAGHGAVLLEWGGAVIVLGAKGTGPPGPR
uniref:Chromosome 6 open reading frame 136 n=1 Tax=Aquila chrysaetos chrysaetos TaxID=223781 RepID=A0A663F4N0_AQUCH